MDRFHGDCTLNTWLCKIARNTLYSHVKKHGSQTDFPVDIIASEDDLEEQFADQDTPRRNGGAVR